MTKQKVLQKNENPMRKVILEKVVLSCSGSAQELEKSQKLLNYLTGKKAHLIRSGPKMRIPDFGVKPLMEVGTRVTLRDEEAKEILKKLLAAIDNQIREESINQNFFSFGIKEYIEIPGVEYKRELGIRGLNVTVVFVRPGVRVKRKKIKAGKLPSKQRVSPNEISTFMKENFGVEVTE